MAVPGQSFISIPTITNHCILALHARVCHRIFNSASYFYSAV